MVMKTRFSIVQKGGFTLIETMFVLGISVFLITVLLSCFVMGIRYWHQTSMELTSTLEGSTCLDRMVYGVGTGMGLRAAYWVTNIGTSSTNWSLVTSNYYGMVWYKYNISNSTILFSNAQGKSIIGTNIIASQVVTSQYGINISLTVKKSDAGYADTNVFSTFVHPRTPKSQ